MALAFSRRYVHTAPSASSTAAAVGDATTRSSSNCGNEAVAGPGPPPTGHSPRTSSRSPSDSSSTAPIRHSGRATTARNKRTHRAAKASTVLRSNSSTEYWTAMAMPPGAPPRLWRSITF
ncbi:hypothetical protein AN219_01815, partial [Streptomyces nanshensis]